ncbi:LPS translocon maturation chaperone LptM [Curvibacter sp. APW13]
MHRYKKATFLAIVCMQFLQACGQTGALYLPAPDSRPSPRPPTTSPQ